MKITVDLTVLNREGSVFGLECRKCGPLTIMGGEFTAAQRFAYEHLQSHGCDLPDIETVEDQ